MFKIQAPYPALTDTLRLRSPDLSNQQNVSHSMVTVRTGNGDLYTYVKPKRGREVHQWEFTISYFKSLEVKEFMRTFGNGLARVTDHNDEVYIGYLTINPFEVQGAGRAGGWAGNEAYGFVVSLEERV